MTAKVKPMVDDSGVERVAPSLDACRGNASVIYDSTLGGYDFGPSHPMSPIRVDLTMRLAEELGVLNDLRLVPAPVASNDLLSTVHTAELIDAVERAGRGENHLDERHGLGNDENPVFADMHHAAAHVTGATVEAVRQVWEGDSLHSANVTGGLHHAMPNRASGFCIYNDLAVGIQWLLDRGAQRVAYVDVDVHHGDGVERFFWDDPRVLTISLHETGQMLFPGTGFAADLGGKNAQGSAVNVALPPGTADAGWLRAFHAVVPDLLRAFDPEILITQHGCDSHMEDPLAHLMLTVDGQRAAYVALHELAHEVAGGRWVATGGGGYSVVDVVPRSWTHLLAIVSGQPLSPAIETPAEWRGYVQTALGQRAPHRLSDGRNPSYRDWSTGMNPDTWLDRMIHATRNEVFPLHGLDPWF